MRSTLAAVSMAALLAAGPALAQDDVLAPETDFLLWCGSAFAFLSADADARGDAEEAALFEEVGQDLSTRGVDILFEGGYSEEEIYDILIAFDDRVVVDFASDMDLPYGADECIAAIM